MSRDAVLRVPILSNPKNECGFVARRRRGAKYNNMIRAGQGRPRSRKGQMSATHQQISPFLQPRERLIETPNPNKNSERASRGQTRYVSCRCCYGCIKDAARVCPSTPQAAAPRRDSSCRDCFQPLDRRTCSDIRSETTWLRSLPRGSQEVRSPALRGPNLMLQ